METFSVLLVLCEGNRRWIPFIEASDADRWCFLLSEPEQTIEQTIETQMISDAIALIMTSQ